MHKTKGGRAKTQAPRGASPRRLFTRKGIIKSKGEKEHGKKKFVVIGGKWFDKVNGNTYNSAKIIDTETGRAYYTPFCYGYGSAYLHEAENYIKEELKQSNAQIIDGGSFYVKKADAKNGNF